MTGTTEARIIPQEMTTGTVALLDGGEARYALLPVTQADLPEYLIWEAVEAAQADILRVRGEEIRQAFAVYEMTSDGPLVHAGYVWQSAFRGMWDCSWFSLRQETLGQLMGGGPAWRLGSAGWGAKGIVRERDSDRWLQAKRAAAAEAAAQARYDAEYDAACNDDCPAYCLYHVA
jgi:hypothetical protein